jgi:hypothetical protein
LPALICIPFTIGSVPREQPHGRLHTT